jgi:hemoglobin-like flavoprotein
MKLVLSVILSMCVAYAAADGCDLLQRFKVKHQWSEAFGYGHDRVEFGVKLFSRFLKDYPDARGLFTRVNGGNIYSAEFKAHAERVLGGLDMTIGLLDDKEALTAQLGHLRDQHKERKINPDYFVKIGNELFELLPEILGVKFDFEAWSACYQLFVAAVSA